MNLSDCNGRYKTVGRLVRSFQSVAMAMYRMDFEFGIGPSTEEHNNN